MITSQEKTLSQPLDNIFSRSRERFFYIQDNKEEHITTIRSEAERVIDRTLPVFVVAHIQRIGCQPEKLFYTVANPARGPLNREKRTKEKVWQHTPSPPPTLLVRRKNK